MQRRHMLIALAGTGLIMPTLALAQSAAGSMAGGMSDKDLMSRIAADGLVSLRASEIAAQRAEHPLVKQFAQLEAEEQQNFLTAMQAMGENPGDSQPSPDRQAQIEQLQAVQGQEFDELYVTRQVTAHRQLLDLNQQLLKNTSTNDRASVLPLLAVPAIKSHIAMLELIQQNLSAGNSASNR